MNNFLKICLLGLFLTSCVNSEQFFDEQKFILLASRNYKLQLNSGTVIPLDTMDSKIMYSVVFSAVEGGESKLLGLWKISESNGYLSKRLKIENSYQQVVAFSVDDLVKLDSDTIDLSDNIFSIHH